MTDVAVPAVVNPEVPGVLQPWLLPPPAAVLLLPLLLLAVVAGTFCSSPVSRALISEGILPWSMAEHHCLYCRETGR